MVEKYDDMLSHFHLIPERYGRTYGRTDGQTDRQTDRFAQYRASYGIMFIKRQQNRLWSDKNNG